MPSNLRSKIHSGPLNRSCVSVAAIGSIQSGNGAEAALTVTLRSTRNLNHRVTEAQRKGGCTLDAERDGGVRFDGLAGEAGQRADGAGAPENESHAFTGDSFPCA